MSVTVAIGPTETQNLVQVSELDPEQMIRFQSTVVADVTGGFLQLTCSAPIDKSVLWVYASAAIGSGSVSPLQYNVTVDGNVVFRHGELTHLVSASAIAEGWRPPGILLNPQAPGALSAIQIIADNVDGDDMTAEAFGFIWDAQVGRNLPQKFFWPGTLG